MFVKDFVGQGFFRSGDENGLTRGFFHSVHTDAESRKGDLAVGEPADRCIKASGTAGGNGGDGHDILRNQPIVLQRRVQRDIGRTVNQVGQQLERKRPAAVVVA